MKKIVALMLALAIVLSFAGCSAKEETTENNDVSTTAASKQNSEITTKVSNYKNTGKSSGKSFDAVMNANEYVLYNNIFFNDQGGEYADKPVIKEGTFAILHDEYNQTERYYVWGYYDNTKCCDWQWEIKPDNIKELPPVGSHVEVTGTFTESKVPQESAAEPHPEYSLDGYWITDAKIKVKKEYKGPQVDVDMSTMDATLENVQAFYIRNAYDTLQGKTVCMYARVKTANSVQHPYYDGTDFEITVESDDKLPAIGEMVLITGTVKENKITNAKLEVTYDY